MQEKQTLGFLNRFDTNQPVQAQKKTSTSNFEFKKNIRLYNLCSEAKALISCAANEQLICVFVFV